MSLSLALSCSIQALPLGSEYLDTVLPKTEAFLRDHAHLLRLLRNRIGGETYHSVMDAVLCAFLPDQVEPCRAFYVGEGTPLVERISRKALAAIDAHLLNSVRLLSSIYREIVRTEVWAEGKSHDAEALEAALLAVNWKG